MNHECLVFTTSFSSPREDVASLTDGIEVARKLFDQQAFGEMVDKEVFPGRDNKEVTYYILRVRGVNTLRASVTLVLPRSSC